MPKHPRLLRAPKNSRQLHFAVIAAFAEAQQVADTHPLPGSAEWWKWRFLCRQALKLNDVQIMKALASAEAEAVA